MNIHSIYPSGISATANFTQGSHKQNKDIEQSFGDLLKSALGEVNQRHLDSDALIQKMLSAPHSVDIHEVTHALSQAEMAISMTKAVTDRVINAYRDLTNLR